MVYSFSAGETAGFQKEEREGKSIGEGVGIGSSL